MFYGTIPEEENLFIWDHYGAWCIDTASIELLYGGEPDSNDRLMGPGIEGFLNQGAGIITLADMYYKTEFIDPIGPQRILEVELETGNMLKEIELDGYYDKALFSEDGDKIYFLDSDDASIVTLHLSPPWETPAEIYPSTNYIQFGEGDRCILRVNVRNGNDLIQNVTVYIWLFTPDGTMLFFDGIGFSPDVNGIPLTLPANIDLTADILSFTMPDGIPEGFYNFNAIFLNDNYEFGPMGTWNFYVGD